MYSLVLMSALSTAPATPQFDGLFADFFRGSCHGSSCQGACNGRSAASNSSSCQGSCHGSCHGGLFNGRIRNFFADLFDPPRSCHGSCSGCSGCSGSCHGSCNGRPRDTRPLDRGYDRPYAGGGCTGCMGGCYGSAPLYLGSCFGSTPNYSCFGTSCTGGLPMNVPLGDYAMPQPAGFGVGGCDACLDGGLPQLGTSLPGGTYPPIPSPGLPAVPRTMPGDGFAQPRPADEVRYKTPLEDEANRGKVLVRVPADARLFVEGKQLSVKDGERTFVTPPLPADREAVYSFKVEYTRDGETLTQTKKVRVRAGGFTSVDFADLIPTIKGEAVKSLPPIPMPSNEPAEATKVPPSPPAFNAQTTTKPADPAAVPTVTPPANLDTAKITVKLPAGATLFVNGGKNNRTESVREFTTPALTPGKVYTYTMRAEITRNGLPEYQESKVEFRAGDALTVDFTSLGEAKAAK